MLNRGAAGGELRIVSNILSINPDHLALQQPVWKDRHSAVENVG
jgi:hypothetical protein